MDAPPPIASIPPDILAIVFRQCVLQPRPVAVRTLALVARRWHEAVWRFFIATRNIRLTALGEQELNNSWSFLAQVTSLEVSSASPALLEQLASVAPKLTTLRFWRGGVSEAAVQHLKQLPSLRHMRCEFYPSPKWRDAYEASLYGNREDVRVCGAISELPHLESLETVITSDSCMHEMRHLKDLSVRGSGSLTTEGLLSMGRVLALQTLVLSDCHAITDAGLTCVALAARETLCSIDVSFCAKLTDESLRALGVCGNLQHVRASFCKALNGSGIEGLHNCPRLVSLDLSYIGVADRAALLYASRLYSLTSLDVSRVRGVTLDGLNAVAESLHSLRRLFVYLDESFGEQALSVASFPHHLVNLSLGASKIASLPPRIAYLPHLRTLNLESLTRLTSRGMAPVAKCTALTQLHLSGCVQLQDPCLNFVRNLTRLQTLDVRFCHGITQRALGDRVPRSVRVLSRAASHDNIAPIDADDGGNAVAPAGRGAGRGAVPRAGRGGGGAK